MFTQTLNPIGSLWVTVLVALMPVAILLFLLAVMRMTAWLATIIVSVLAIPLCVLVWHAPLHDVMRSFFFGGLTGIWAIDWITFWGLMIFNTLVLTGDFGRFKTWLVHHATADISDSDDLTRMGFRRAAGGFGRIRLSLGGGRSDSSGLRSCRPRCHSRGGAGQ